MCSWFMTVRRLRRIVHSTVSLNISGGSAWFNNCAGPFGAHEAQLRGMARAAPFCVWSGNIQVCAGMPGSAAEWKGMPVTVAGKVTNLRRRP